MPATITSAAKTIAAAISTAPLSFSDDIEDLLLRQQPVGPLGPLEDGGDPRLRGGMAPLLQPVDHVGLSAQGPDRDLLLAAELARRHSRVYPVGQPRVPLLEGLDDRRGVDAGRCPEGVPPDDGIA